MVTPPNFIKSPKITERDTGQAKYYENHRHHNNLNRESNEIIFKTISSDSNFSMNNNQISKPISISSSNSNSSPNNHIQVTKKTKSFLSFFSWGGSTNSSYNEELTEIFEPAPKPRKEISLYRKSHLPKDGWIQACFLCYTYTSDTLFVKKKEYPKYILEFNVFVCDSCQHGILPPKDFNIELSNMVDEYIDDYLILP
jgi:hypothetical protein